jgi:uncharacterized protein
MEFTGRYSIPAIPTAVWDALNDPETLRACMPGCERLDRVAPHQFKAVAVIRIGPVRATFRAHITQTEIEPPRRCILTCEGQGGAAGFARGEAEVVLTPDENATLLVYRAKATIGGKLAKIGQRLIDRTAKHIADDFFCRFSNRVALTAESSPAEQITPADIVAIPAAPGSVTERRGVAPEIWVVGLIAIIVILLAVFGIIL